MTWKLTTVTHLYYSPCGHTKRITINLAQQLVKGLELTLKEIDFTLPAARVQNYSFARNELLVIGFPTYAGKLPNKILPDIKARLKGNDTPVIPLVTFGNRNFDNSLAELCAVMEEAGFKPIAAAAMVSEHVFSEKLASGRPSQLDLEELADFGHKVLTLIKRGSSEQALEIITDDNPDHLLVPGEAKAPYYQPCGIDDKPVNFLKAKPKTHSDLCTHCGICAQVCPMGSIDPTDTNSVPGICIKCQACVKHCPTGAEYFDDEAFLSHVRMLEENFVEPKNNSFYFLN
ncbi:MAG: 4Fe-4S binding protein [Eubacteriales bacterium]|nr:4Fe-4S binding protein [Eubacteriales bacterium]